jgi:prepilin-type N-terminal cleavage/methylation domain-containing protein
MFRLDKNKSRAFTLVELLVSITISAILILMIVHISSIAFASHSKMRRDSQVYAEVFSVFSFVEHALRNTYSVGVDLTGNRLTADGKTFYASAGSFIFQEGGVDNHLIDGVNGLNFAFACDPVSGIWGTCSPASSIFRVSLSGTKDNQPFDISTDIVRRNL